MSREEAQRAEQLLRSVRRAVTPTRADAARTFAGVEARLGLALGGADSLSSDSLPSEALPSQVPAAASGATAPSAPAAPQGGLAGSTSTHSAVNGAAANGAAANGAAANGAAANGAAARRDWPLFAQPLARGALVVAFGLGTGAVGYFLGRADARPQRDPKALPAPPSLGAPLPISPPASPAAISPATLPAAALPPPVAAARAEEPPAQHPVASGSANAHPRSSRRAASRAVLRTPARPSSDPGSALREALELLGRAEAALRRNDGLAARMWLSDLDRRAAREVLLEERLVAATLASCLLEDVADARQTLRQLEQLNPESMYRARLEGSCVGAGDFPAGSDSKIGSAGH